PALDGPGVALVGPAGGPLRGEPLGLEPAAPDPPRARDLQPPGGPGGDGVAGPQGLGQADLVGGVARQYLEQPGLLVGLQQRPGLGPPSAGHEAVRAVPLGAVPPVADGGAVDAEGPGGGADAQALLLDGSDDALPQGLLRVGGQCPCVGNVHPPNIGLLSPESSSG